MRTLEDIEKAIELALSYRDQCLEWAAIAPTPDLAANSRRMAVVWDKQAADMKRDAATIADSRRMIAETERLLANRNLNNSPEHT